MANIYQQLVSKYGDDALKMINKLKSGAKEVIDDVPYPKNITQDALAESQGFKTIGKPYSTDFTMVPEGTGLPAIRANTMPAIIPKVLPAEEIGTSLVRRTAPIVDDVGTSLMKTTDDVVAEMAPKSNNIRNIALGTAGLGGAAYMMSGDDKTSEQVPKSSEPKATIKETPLVAKPEQSVAKSTTTGKASVVDNVLENKVPEIASSSSKEDSINQMLEEARQKDNEHQLLFGMLKAAQMGGSAAGGSKADTTFADTELAKQNQSFNRIKSDEDLRQQKKKSIDEDVLRDPNSSASQQARDIARKVGLKISDATTAKELADAGLPIGTLLTQKLSIDSKKEEAEFKRQLLSLSKTEKNEQYDEKQKLEVQKTVDKLVNNLRNSDDYKTYQATKSAQAALDNAIASGNKTDTGSAFMLYAKIAQGDNSVVRESDMKNLAGSYNYKSPSEMFSKLSAKASGGNFSAEELKQMKNISTLIQNIKANHVKEQLEPITTRIQNHKLDANEIISPEITREFSGEFNTASPKNSAPINSGNLINLPSKRVSGKSLLIRGKTYTVNPDGLTATEQ